MSLSLAAFADPVTPVLKSGQFVYQSPAGYMPPRINASMLEDLQRQAASQKYPFYIVLMDQVANDQEASRIGNKFLDDWAHNSRFNVQRSSLFLVTFTGDRKYRLFPASEWRSKLGLEKNESGDALVRFTSLFVRSAKSGNPIEGIGNLMENYNAYIFDRIDPVKIAQREKASQEQAERQRIYEEEKARAARFQRSIGSLNSQIERMERLLATKDFIPADTSPYQRDLAQARIVRDNQVPEEMERRSESLGRSCNELQNYLSDRISEDQKARSRRTLLFLATMFSLVGLILIGGKRRSVYLKERGQFTREIEAWKTKISGARLRYYDKVYSQDSDYYTQKLKEYPSDSETGKLYQATVQETDSIISQVEALSIHVDACEKLAKSATAINLSPLRQAATKLNESFEFDTQQISSKLMDPISTTLKINPHIEEENLNSRFEQVIQSWDMLKRALNNSTIPASDLFKHDDLDLMITKAKDNGIPLRWLKGHPLNGDTAQDQALFAVLDAPRQTDPILYCREVEKNLAVQARIGQDLDRLIEAKRLAISEEVTELSGLEGTVLGPDDDPKITLDRARQNQDRLAGLLESSDTVEEVEQQADKVHSLFQTCNAQAGAARSAIASAHQEIERANTLSASLVDKEKEAGAAVQMASQMYANTRGANSALEAGRRHLATGRSNLDQAVTELNKKSHLAALRLATMALDQFANGKDRFEAVDRAIADLERARLQYDQMVGQMDSLYDDAVSKVRGYNGFTGNMTGYRRLASFQGPVDYALQISMLNAQQQLWQTDVLNAKRDYDIEIARQQAEERRRHEAQLEQQRHSSFMSSSSSSSSSSGGSWSSSGGDSGGSWGGDSGGSSGSSGGDSGGSW